MTDHLLPDDQADGLVDGTLHDAPHHLRGAADVLGAARQPATAGELAGMSARVQQFAAVLATPADTTPRSRSMLGSRITRRAATAIVATLLTAGTAAAAAGGVLPSPFEGTSDVAHVDPSTTDVIIEDAATTTSTTTDPATSAEPVSVDPATWAEPTTAGPSSTDDQRGPDATGPAAFGLCTAWTHGAPKNTNNPAFGALQRAADAAGQSIDDYCATVLDGKHGDQQPTESTNASTEPSTSADDTAHDQSGSHGQPGSSGHGGSDNAGHGKGHGKGQD